MTRRARVLLGVLVVLTVVAVGLHVRDRVAAASPEGPPEPPPGAGTRGDKTTASLRILFVGNSYTFVHDLPGRLRELALAAVPARGVYVESVVRGGATLRTLWNLPEVGRAFDAAGFTHVVIQGQSTEPLNDPGDFQVYAGKLVARAKRMGAVPVLYETWARREGNPLYRQAFTGGSPAAMLATIRGAYERAASETGARLARVGEARAFALAKRPGLPLFEPDGTHPSAVGAELGARVVLEAITGGALPLSAVRGLPEDESEAIMAAAQAVRSPPAASQPP